MNDNNNMRYTNTQISVNTSMMTIWDSTSGAQLKLSLLNNGLGVAIWLPFTGADGSRKYPTENRFSTVLSQKNALAMEKLIDDYIIPAYEKGANTHMGVFTNGSHSVMLEIEVRDGTFYLLMHRGCDPATRITKDTIRFKFDSVMITDNYDSSNGEMNVIPIQADFFVFAKAVSAYNDLAGGMFAAHGSAVASMSFNNKFMDYMRAIAESVHAQLPVPSYQQNGGYRYQQSQQGVSHNYNVDNVNAAGNLPPVATMEVNSLADLVS